MIVHLGVKGSAAGIDLFLLSCSPANNNVYCIMQNFRARGLMLFGNAGADTVRHRSSSNNLKEHQVMKPF